MTIGIIIVDHGSRRRESNEMLHEAARRFAEDSAFPIVEPAHMELATPTIRQAFSRCVERGASRIIVFPYFLSPGRHWTEDIPALVREAAAAFPQVTWLVTAPFGLHPAMQNIIQDRIETCMRTAAGDQPAGCDVCHDATKCQFFGEGTDL
jgi:sirohydrochlorin ferrochelatase